MSVKALVSLKKKTKLFLITKRKIALLLWQILLILKKAVYSWRNFLSLLESYVTTFAGLLAIKFLMTSCNLT